MDVLEKYNRLKRKIFSTCLIAEECAKAYKGTSRERQYIIESRLLMDIMKSCNISGEYAKYVRDNNGQPDYWRTLYKDNKPVEVTLEEVLNFIDTLEESISYLEGDNTNDQ